MSRRRLAMRNVHDLQAAEIYPRRTGDSLYLGGGTNENGDDEPCLRSLDRAGQSRCFAREGHCGRNGLQTLAPFEQPFVLPGSGFLIHLYTSTRVIEGDFRTAVPVSFNRKARTIAIATPYRSGTKASW